MTRFLFQESNSNIDHLTAENEGLENQTEQLLKQLEDLNNQLIKYVSLYHFLHILSLFETVSIGNFIDSEVITFGWQFCRKSKNMSKSKRSPRTIAQNCLPSKFYNTFLRICVHLKFAKIHYMSATFERRFLKFPIESRKVSLFFFKLCSIQVSWVKNIKMFLPHARVKCSYQSCVCKM